MNCCTAGDGVFSLLEGSHIKLVDLKSNNTTNLISILDVKDVSIDSLGKHMDLKRFLQEEGRQLPIYDWKLSDDMKHVLIKGSHKKVCF
jgi:dipeptidyl aminopeptidase